jgi:hypothetical protein
VYSSKSLSANEVFVRRFQFKDGEGGYLQTDTWDLEFTLHLV